MVTTEAQNERLSDYNKLVLIVKTLNKGRLELDLGWVQSRLYFSESRDIAAVIFDPLNNQPQLEQNRDRIQDIYRYANLEYVYDERFN